jgi:hypothetical protein
MNDQPKREFAPYITLATQIGIAGGELLEMAGAICERESADENKLIRAERAVRKAAEALAEYRRIDDADPVLTWPRPASHGNGASRLPDPPGMRAAHMLPDDAARNGPRTYPPTNSASTP